MKPISVAKPLRILSVLNLDWNPHLGAARVYVELIQQWRAAGHEVEHFSFSEAFPKRHQSPRQYAIRRLSFPFKAASFVKANAGRFDVIDALAGSLARPRKSLGFDGLIVARSVASHRLYDRFERSISQRWPDHPNGTMAGRLFYSAINRWLSAAADASIRHADLINVANTEEATFLRENCGVQRPILVQPYGLTAENRSSLFSSAASPLDRLKRKTVSFIGMWGARKGSRIWGEIVRRVREQIPDAEFWFLGTMVQPEVVMKDIGPDSSWGVHSVPEYSPAQLPQLLSRCAVGAFPSFVEAFGLAVLEQLAAGIPTISFDQGGPRDILGPQLPELLVTTGDVESFANRLVRILQLPPCEYERLVQASLNTAERYSWSSIADETVAQYGAALTSSRSKT